MGTHKSVLFLILARAGSKGVPDKNIKPLGKLPLIAYRILTAKKSRHESDVVVSTDSQKYREIAESYGADCPFLRPAELASDTAQSVDAVLHAVQWLKDHQRTYDYICLLEPTNPFTKTNWLDEAITRLKNAKGETLVACKYSSPHPFFIQDEGDVLDKVGKNIQEASRVDRQVFKKQITPSGNFYLAKMDVFLRDKSFYSPKTLTYMIPEPYSLEIDHPTDFQWAEFLVEKKIITESELTEA